MTAPRRRFEVVAPDWGQAHLTSDAVVAFVDDELSAAAHTRAEHHLETCPDCASEVAAQAQARSALRSAHMPALSSSLLHALRAIPRDAELPGRPAGPADGAAGYLVQPQRGPVARSGRRLGSGLAASGLAIGALALTVSLLPTGAAVDRGVLGGAVFEGGVLDARLRAPVPAIAEPVAVTPVGVAGPGLEAVMRRLDALPAAFPPPGR